MKHHAILKSVNASPNDILIGPFIEHSQALFLVYYGVQKYQIAFVLTRILENFLHYRDGLLILKRINRLGHHFAFILNFEGFTALLPQFVFLLF